jgi:hypothetical protein
MEEVGQVDAAEELGPDMVGHRVDDGGAVIGGINVHPEGAGALIGLDDGQDRLGDGGDISTRRLQLPELRATWSISPAYRASYASATAWSAGLPLFAK